MILKTITDKGKKEIVISDCWKPEKGKDPVTTDQFIQIVRDWDGKDLVKLFSILTNTEYKVLADTHDYVLEESLILATRFMYEDKIDLSALPLPHWITIDGKQIRIPPKIGGLSIGQNIHVRQEMEKCQVYEELIAYALAIYLQPLYDEDVFDFHRAMELEQKILKMPIVETYALGFFLLKPMMKSGRSFMRELNRVMIQLRDRLMPNARD